MSFSAAGLPDRQTEAAAGQDDFTHLLGDELRHARKQRHWSRKELRSRLTGHVSLPTLASYELGTRHCPINRFVEICEALETTAPELLARVLRRSDHGTEAGGLHIDLLLVARDKGSTFHAFRRWAQYRLATSSGAETSIRLATPAVERLAELCDLTTPALVTNLTALGAVQRDERGHTS
jgi:transcriptional regulator with XRE-family HTH domain